MKLSRITASPFNIDVTHDEKRQGYFVVGDGFDFFMYHVGDFKEPPRFGIECDHVVRMGFGNGYAVSIHVPLLQDPMSESVLKNAINRALMEHEAFYMDSKILGAND